MWIYRRHNSSNGSTRNLHIINNVRSVSTVHACLIGVLSVTILLSDTDGVFSNNIYSTYSHFAEACIGILFGYLLWCDNDQLTSNRDTVQMTLNKHHAPDWLETMIHHVCIIIPSATCVFRKRGLFICAGCMLFELSTPFLNMRWFIRATGKEHSAAFEIASVLFGVSFFLARVLPLIYFLYANFFLHYMQKATWEYWLYHSVSLGWISLSALNFWWFYLIARNALKGKKKKE
jgi:hypothetical protein